MADYLRVKQIRPLLFAVARHFDPIEADKAFRLFVSWSVRFLSVTPAMAAGVSDRMWSLEELVEQTS
jgi:hypothetical protein